MTSKALSSTPTLRQHSLYVFSTMFLTAFYVFFRIGELAVRSACHTTVIPYDNIQFLASGGKIHSIKITITYFKHNTSNRPFDIVIPGDESSPFCTVKFILRYCNLRGNKPGLLFCHADNCWFSHDVTKIQTTKLSILLRFVLECRFVLGCIRTAENQFSNKFSLQKGSSKLSRDAAFT